MNNLGKISHGAIKYTEIKFLETWSDVSQGSNILMIYMNRILWDNISSK